MLAQLSAVVKGMISWDTNGDDNAGVVKRAQTGKDMALLTIVKMDWEDSSRLAHTSSMLLK